MAVVVALTAASLAAILRLQFKIEHTKLVINQTLEEMGRCTRVQLLATREDVIQAMGQPTREEEVPSVTGGMASRMYFQYSILKVQHPPYVDLDHHFKKVVAVDCALAPKSLRQLVKTGQAQLPKEEALPTDRKRF